MDEDLRTMIQDRMGFVLNEIKDCEQRKDDIVLGKFMQGKLAAMNGVTGEQQFLEKLLEYFD